MEITGTTISSALRIIRRHAAAADVFLTISDVLDVLSDPDSADLDGMVDSIMIELNTIGDADAIINFLLDIADELTD